jgi:two-component sensor histidine kinase
MNSFDALARNHTGLDEEDLAHLRRLISSWGMLSDLCFADLLLFAPLAGGNNSRFVVLGQARPTTSQTFHLDVLVGRVVDEFERPMIARAWRRNEIVEAEDVVLGRGERARVQCIPVVRNGQPIAVLSRESPLTVGRRPGQLERVYIESFQRLARMITAGQFPFEEDLWDKSSPRIGDGSLVLDADRRILFASPNAMNAMHRMGFLSNVIGSRLEEIGIRGHLVKQAYDTGRPQSDEIEPRLNVSLAITCVPMLDGDVVNGALVMMRDVTDLRRLDRLLLSKDATIREIHHRVKNNLQTITSLLDLQARRLDSGPARTALEEAHRRVRSIALVHEILSREATEQIAFNEIIEPLVRVAAQTALVSDHHVEFDVVGDAGELEASVATPLAVVLAEVLANAVEHAFPDGNTSDGEPPMVRVKLLNDGRVLSLNVVDNGDGLPDGFSIQSTKSLGLSITRSLVESQLQGHIDMRSDEGTIVEISIPIRQFQ